MTFLGYSTLAILNLIGQVIAFSSNGQAPAYPHTTGRGENKRTWNLVKISFCNPGGTLFQLSGFS